MQSALINKRAKTYAVTALETMVKYTLISFDSSTADFQKKLYGFLFYKKFPQNSTAFFRKKFKLLLANPFYSFIIKKWKSLICMFSLMSFVLIIIIENEK